MQCISTMLHNTQDHQTLVRGFKLERYLMRFVFPRPRFCRFS